MIAAAACGATLAVGGTVITANLPANTAIIDISATADGAAAFNGNQTLWFRPFNTSNNLLEYTVQPGTYDFRIVDPADAGALFPSLTAGQLGQIFTAWTFNAPWITTYLVFDAAAATNANLSQLFAGAVSPAIASNATAAYNAAINGGYFDQIVLGATNSGNVQTTFQFTQAETLIFAIPDNILSDNTGGVSVLISPATAGPTAPEPATLLMASASLTLFLFWRRRFANRVRLGRHPIRSGYESAAKVV
jgi:hypothetical protein